MSNNIDVSHPPYEGPSILIAGPTASGKSALALEAAERWNGEIINADAIQVYQDLEVLSARPSTENLKMTPHHLYGVLDGAQRCSVGMWTKLAQEALNKVAKLGKTPILVGGTGLYFRAVTEGLSPIPSVDDTTRKEAHARLSVLGRDGFYDEVVKQDPNMARLAPGDTQRLLRAWEVYHVTGEALSSFQKAPGVPLLVNPSVKLVLAPERETLYERCENRLDLMVEAGALEEAQRLIDRKLDKNLPIMKAVGAAELMAYLIGALEFEQALNLAKQNTRRFAKRQLTWFRNQTPNWRRAENLAEALQHVEHGMLRCGIAPNGGK